MFRSMTRIRLSVAVAALVGVLALHATASAGPPPPHPALFGATHAQPVAGRSFAGLSIIPLQGAYISTVSCDARLGRKTLHARVLRYHPTRGNKPLAVTCSWRIPTGAEGKRLRLSRELITTTTGDEASGPPFVWTVKK
jgi:hypothetical protein